MDFCFGIIRYFLEEIIVNVFILYVEIFRILILVLCDEMVKLRVKVKDVIVKIGICFVGGDFELWGMMIIRIYSWSLGVYFIKFEDGGYVKFNWVIGI